VSYSVLNVHDPTEDKTGDVKGSFYKELESKFDKLPKYHMNIEVLYNILREFGVPMKFVRLIKVCLNDETYSKFRIGTRLHSNGSASKYRFNVSRCGCCFKKRCRGQEWCCFHSNINKQYQEPAFVNSQ
jgi:hypothetical protein